MALTSCCFLVAFVPYNLLLATSALSEHQGTDALALVQQRAHVKPQTASLARMLEDSFRTQPTAYEEIAEKVIRKVGEARLRQFWRKLMEIGQARNMTRGQRGLLLAQESARVLTNGEKDGGPLDWIWESSRYKEFTKEKSEPHSCIVTRVGILLDLGDLAVSLGYPMGKKCDIEGFCLASALDILRSLVYLAREITASEFSYCTEKISYPNLCGASAMGVFAEMTGVVHSSISLKYKCDEDTYNGQADAKIFGFGARKVVCGWDITRGAAYAIAGIYRAYWFFSLGVVDETYVDDTDGSLWRPTRGDLEAGQSGAAYGLTALGGFAWMANALITALTNCPDESKEVAKKNPACGKEVAELVAYVFQTFGWAQNVRDYCMDIYDKNTRRKGSTDLGNTEERFKDQVIQKMSTMTIHKMQYTDQELYEELQKRQLPPPPTNVGTSDVGTNQELLHSGLTPSESKAHMEQLIDELLVAKNKIPPKLSGVNDVLPNEQQHPGVEASPKHLETVDVASNIVGTEPLPNKQLHPEVGVSPKQIEIANVAKDVIKRKEIETPSVSTGDLTNTNLEKPVNVVVVEEGKKWKV